VRTPEPRSDVAFPPAGIRFIEPACSGGVEGAAGAAAGAPDGAGAGVVCAQLAEEITKAAAAPAQIKKCFIG